ncbi:MAG: peptidoglycan editing factor PgeF [Polyangiales bacterium]
MSDVLRAPALTAAGFRHGFTTRAGGVSEGPFATMNLAVHVGDDPARVFENHRRLAERVGYDLARLHWRSQVHGGVVHEAQAGEDPAELRALEADGLVARDAGEAVSVRVADCVPVLLADPETGAVAAVHAGWRGVEARVVEEGLRVMAPREAGAVIAALGPSIGPCCFEVGDDVAARIAAVSAPEVVVAGGPKPRVDLWRALEVQLAALGVTTVERVGGCTMCDAERFHSFRRDGKTSGRMVGVIVAGARPPTR